MTIRRATPDDLPAIMALLEMGRQTMRNNGNTFQWNGYPTENQILADIADGNSYLICHGDKPVATFAMIIGEEPTYKTIYDGQWLDDEPYHVIHRIASTPQSHGILDTVLDFSESIAKNIRIDTHEANIIMRKGLEKHGYQYCGIIHLLNGDERMAFQKKA